LPLYSIASEDNPTFLTPKGFESGPYIIKPSVSEEVALCLKIPGPILVDQKYVQSPLRDDEFNLRQKRAFERLMRCLMKIRADTVEGLEDFLCENLDATQLDVC
jgi:hypothetical protein